MGKYFNSKSADILFAVLLGWFAWNRYADGQTSIAILLAVIAALNLLSFAIKLNIDRKTNPKQ
ncbi:hypothetical protein [Sporosarcina trichiuri]|uniref:hypothetical protein n=1 Tax=Sporosarcina trichiuri TaxID=3056445 RepID=UPI0025B4AE05|nr:hypothetical protein [Sporosarcina sp. 0.2-SM1T-5]WJY27893.1 hypothetical protein QWT68_02635 [Sporosarcina sp. 0.2-SM1T-5]